MLMTIERLNAQLDELNTQLSIVKNEQVKIFDMLRAANQAVQIAVDTLSNIADEKTNCDWAARQSALNALVRIRGIKFPD